MRKAQGSLQWTRWQRVSSTGAAKTPDAIGRDRRRLHRQAMRAEGGSICGTAAGCALPLGLTTAQSASGGERGIRCAAPVSRRHGLLRRRGITRVLLQ